MNVVAVRAVLNLDMSSSQCISSRGRHLTCPVILFMESFCHGGWVDDCSLHVPRDDYYCKHQSSTLSSLVFVLWHTLINEAVLAGGGGSRHIPLIRLSISSCAILALASDGEGHWHGGGVDVFFLTIIDVLSFFPSLSFSRFIFSKIKNFLTIVL